MSVICSILQTRKPSPLLCLSVSFALVPEGGRWAKVSTKPLQIPDPACRDVSLSLFLGFGMTRGAVPAAGLGRGSARAVSLPCPLLGRSCWAQSLGRRVVLLEGPLDADMHPDHWGCWYKKLLKKAKMLFRLWCIITGCYSVSVQILQSCHWENHRCNDLSVSRRTIRNLHAFC